MDDIDYDIGKKAVIELLLHNPIYTKEGVLVQLLDDYRPEKTIPSITFDVEGGGAINRTSSMINVLSPLAPSHPYYDEANPDTLYAQHKYRIVKVQCDLGIHVWSYSQEEREYIHNQINRILVQCMDAHYSTCGKYNLETKFCSQTNSYCEARNEIDNPNFVLNNLSIKGKCPYLKIKDESADLYRGSVNFLKKYGIDVPSIQIFKGVPLDEMDDDSIVYHMSQKLYFDTYQKEIFEALPLCKVNRTRNVL